MNGRSHTANALRRQRPARLATLVLSALLQIAVGPLLADEAPPRFLIEGVEVAGLSLAPETIVLSESLLQPGESYSERELQSALHRITRLPFVQAARFRLSRGSEPGRFVLTIDIDETLRFFISGDLEASVSDDPISKTGVLSLFESDFELFRSSRVGTRVFVGAHSEFFVAADNGTGLQVGARHYNLFNRRAVGTVVVRGAAVCCRGQVLPLAVDPGISFWLLDGELALAGQLSVPLGSQHGWVASFESTRSDEGTRNSAFGYQSPFGFFDTFYSFEDFRLHRGELGWQLDTTDDPLAPRSGTRLGGQLELLLLSSQVRDLRTHEVYDSRARYLRATLSGAHHRALTLRHSVFVESRLALGRSRLEEFPIDGERVEGDLEAVEASLRLGHRAVLWAPRSRETRPQLWIETSIAAATEQTFSDDAALLESSLDSRRLETALVLRSSWGVLRLALSWVDWERR
jgi:hypothetical protein